MSNVQKEWAGLIARDEVNGSVRDNLGGIAFLVFDLRSIPPIAMLVVVAATGEEADKLIKAMVDRIVPRFVAQMPFAEERGLVAVLFHEPGNRQFGGFQSGRVQMTGDHIDDPHALLVVCLFL